jgi:hypothetical protein
MLADAEAKLEESRHVIAALRASKSSLQDMLQQSINETDMKKLAREAFEEETLELLEEEKQNVACFDLLGGRNRMWTL